MELNEYHKLAMRTANRELPWLERYTNAALGLAGEAGEVCDHLKKHVHHGHPFDREAAKKELGDLLWYVTQGADALGCTLEEIAQGNIDKLRRRYPDGFSSEASMARADREVAE